MADTDLTAERLRELFEYSVDTGRFTRLTTRGPAKAGPVTTRVDRKGYLILTVDYKKYRAHRLAVLYVTGAMPLEEIDHRDGDRSNNCLANLRPASREQNMQNRHGAQKNNKTGVLGVSRGRGRKRWLAQIGDRGKTVYLGTYATQEMASAAYLEAKRAAHPFNTL